MRSFGWLWIAFSLLALEPPRAHAADLRIEQVWDQAEENALRVPRALLFSGALVAATALGSAYVGHQRTVDLQQCGGAGCRDLDRQRFRVNIATSVLSIAAVTLLVSGGQLLAKRKHARATARPVPLAPPSLVLCW